ncbi:MAG: hypothetical protein U0736_02255 [Gemmataceae bacterium]
MSTLPPDLLPPEVAHKRDRLLAIFRDLGSCAVAFSGGIDSTVVAAAAHRALGARRRRHRRQPERAPVRAG